MTPRALALATVLLAASLAGPARAASVDDRLFVEAHRAYTTGRHAEARERYEQLVQKGHQDPALYYNLGNACFRLNLLGRAIWAYERALRLDPEHPEVRHNLALARDTVQSRVKDKVVGARRPSLAARLVGAVPVSTASVLFLILWWAFFGGLVALVLLPRGVLRAILIVGVVLAGLASAVLGTIYHQGVRLESGVQEAIVLEDTVPVREGPRGVAVKTFEVHAGLRVEVAAREDSWLKIRLPNGLEGWVPSVALGEL
jgi:hypothetical protein